MKNICNFLKSVLRYLTNLEIKQFPKVFFFYKKRDRKAMEDEFEGLIYFSHGKNNLSGVLTVFCGQINVVIKNS